MRSKPTFQKVEVLLSHPPTGSSFSSPWWQMTISRTAVYYKTWSILVLYTVPVYCCRGGNKSALGQGPFFIYFKGTEFMHPKGPRPIWDFALSGIFAGTCILLGLTLRQLWPWRYFWWSTMAIAKNGKAMAHGIGVTISKKEDMTVFWLVLCT